VRYRRIGYRYTMIVNQPIGWAAAAGARRRRVLSTPLAPGHGRLRNETALTVTVELAGVDAEQLEFVLFEDALVIEAAGIFR